MNWEQLTDLQQLKQLTEASYQVPVLFFKHSTRCSISVMVLNRFEREWNNMTVHPYFLDLLNYREVSNQIAIFFEIEHQSPQVLLIKDGSCVYHASHNAIDAHVINEFC
ncbi:MAG: bacillithiol system redox-active protein YtxJ [Flavobacteriales bacterium]|mgnify:FL=1|nr:bacillithiol system redox-active protein YtxJ [Flavobacteriales bacterium]|tara:strand:+ start:808 stop:1134 length:327 start_codon:yes stop_codon:yes gene_type:complete